MTLKLMKMKTLVMVIILFLLTVSLGIATYSWYIVSTAPTIHAVETYMKVIDPVLSIARATDETTPPEEVSNQDARNSQSGSQEDKYYDITWGAIVESFKNDTLQLDYPATFENIEKKLMTASFSPTGRVADLVPLKESKLGYDMKGEEDTYGIRYYTDPEGKKVCAMGLGVWVRVNKEDNDLVMSVANTTIQNAAGDVVVSNESAKVMARVLSPGYPGEQYIPTEYYDNTGTHVAVIYDNETIGEFPPNEPILVEIIVYMEGQVQNTEDATNSQTGILAKNVNQTLYVNIESVTFYDNLDIVADHS